MEETTFSIYSRQDFCMSKTMHLHIQHGRLNIKEARQENRSPHYLLFKQRIRILSMFGASVDCGLFSRNSVLFYDVLWASAVST